MVQPLPWVTIAPSIRYHTQSAAKFYYDPVYDPLARRSRRGT